MKLKNYDSAKIWLNKCSDDFQCLDHISVIYSIEGDFNNAINYQKEALLILPNPGGFYNLGTIYSMQRTNESCEKAIFYFDEALKFEEKAWEIVTKNSQLIYSGKNLSKENALLNKGYCLMNLNKLNESLQIFKELENQGRNDHKIYYNLAVNYVKLQDYETARSYITKSLNLNPNDSEAKSLLLKILMQSQNN